MSIKILYEGDQADIYAYVDGRNEVPALDFIEGLPPGDQKKAVRLIEEFSKRGEIWNREKFRLEEKPIYAFKSFQIRILCFYLPSVTKRTLILTHGFKKKKDDMPKAELERAKRIHDDIISELTNARN